MKLAHEALVKSATALEQIVRLYHCQPGAESRAASFDLEYSSETAAEADAQLIEQFVDQEPESVPGCRFGHLAALLVRPTDSILSQLFARIPYLEEIAVRLSAFHEQLSLGITSGCKFTHTLRQWNILLNQVWFNSTSVTFRLHETVKVVGDGIELDSESHNSSVQYGLRIQLAEIDAKILERFIDVLTRESPSLGIASQSRKAGPVPSRRNAPKRGRRKSDRQVTPLTSRQLEVLQLYGELHGNVAEIARRLGISYATAKEHLHAAFKKTGNRGVKHRTVRQPQGARGESLIAEDDDVRLQEPDLPDAEK